MKTVKRLFIIAVVFFAIGEIIIAITHFTKQNEIDRIDDGYQSKMITIDEDIVNLFIDATGADVDIMYGNRPMLSIDNCYMDGFSYSVEEGTLKINQRDPSVINFMGWSFPGLMLGSSSGNNSRITLCIPEDMMLDNATVTVGKGDVNIEQLACRRVVAQVGFGDLCIQKVKGLEKYAYQSKLGKTELNIE